MKLYNTLTRQIDELLPLAAPKVTVYTCGPTVYDYLHIGNWITYVREDILIRTLKLSGYQPDWVMNITDVGHLVSDADEGEDKLEKGAKREGKTAWQVAEYYTTDFLECLQKLNITMPDHITKATEHIAEQIALVQTLEDKGFTYIIDDGVYYDTSKFEGYAAFARLDLENLQAGARVDYNRQKRNPSDFALWKFSPQNEQRDMEWDSPWAPPGQESAKGFPGWHIECSAMAMKYLGETLDIHAGGIDHIPVHHTNEIAQSEAATGKRFANHWLHTNHVLFDGTKISKSLGNGIRLQTLLEEGYSIDAIRLYILESHYRTQSQFDRDGLTAATNRLAGLQAWADLRWQSAAGSEASAEQIQNEILSALHDDLNTAQALAIISSYTGKAVDDFESLLAFLDSAFGLHLSIRTDITGQQKQLIADRLISRQNKDWTESDRLRQLLESDGIGLRDSSASTQWYRL